MSISIKYQHQDNELDELYCALTSTIHHNTIMMNITKVYYNDYIDISIDMLPCIIIADNYLQTIDSFESKKIKAPYLDDELLNQYMEKSDKVISDFKSSFTQEFTNAMTILIKQIDHIYCYLNDNSLIATHHIVKLPHIKLMFYQILTVIHNTNIQLANIVKKHGDKQTIYEKIIKILHRNIT